MAGRAKSYANPYGINQIPEWELWETANDFRNSVYGYEAEATKFTKAAKVANSAAVEIEAALAKLRPPELSPKETAERTI